MPKHHIVLYENEIEKIINGEEVSIVFKQPINIGEKIIIRQSYAKDMTAPIINRDKKIYSNAEIENIKIVASALTNTMRMGV